MNAINRPTQFDWVINYIEMNSRPVSNDGFRRFRITNGQIRIDPAGIVLSIGEATEKGLVLDSGEAIYLGSFTERGNELVMKLQRADDQGSILIVAKKSVCKFETQLPVTSCGTFRGHLEASGTGIVLAES